MVNYDFLSVYFYSVPNLRFSFEEDWCTSTIGENFRLSSGLTPSTKEKAYFNNGIIPWINSGELKNKYISFTENKLTLDAVKKHNLTIYPMDTMVIAIYGLEAAGVRGKASITKMDSTISQSCMAFNSLGNVLTQFMYYVYKKEAQILGTRYAQGTKQQNLSSDLLSSYKLLYPSKEEQLKIVNFLSLIDEKIETQSKIINDYKILKNHIIKSFIKQNGTSYLLLEIAELGRGRVINSAEISKQKNPIYPVYSSQTSNNGIMGYLDNYDYEGEYITWTTDGANAGTVYYRNGKFNCTNVCGILKIKNGYDAYYISNILNCYTKKYVSTNLANPKLMNNVMANIKINLPSIEQQKHSSKILQSIEYRVEIEEDIKLNLVKQKAFLLKNMFI
jgi:type I restriction enzyme S subunit